MKSRYTLKDLRKIKRLTIDELSEQTGIDTTILKAIELDSGQAEFNDLAKLSRFYGIGLDYIFIGKQSDFGYQLKQEVVNG